MLHNGQLFAALHVHQAQPGQTPPDHPELWEPLPMTAKGQLVKFCDPNDPDTAEFFEIGQNGTEEEARAVLGAALAVCHPVDPMPSSGITEDAIHFMVPDGDTFQPAPTNGTVYYETMSALRPITVDPLGSGQIGDRERTDHERRHQLPAAARCATRATSSRRPTGRPSPPASRARQTTSPARSASAPSPRPTSRGKANDRTRLNRPRGLSDLVCKRP